MLDLSLVCFCFVLILYVAHCLLSSGMFCLADVIRIVIGKIFCHLCVCFSVLYIFFLWLVLIFFFLSMLFSNFMMCLGEILLIFCCLGLVEFIGSLDFQQFWEKIGHYFISPLFFLFLRDSNHMHIQLHEIFP